MAPDTVAYSSRSPLVFPDVGVIIYAAPKAACSSIKQTLAESYKIKGKRRVVGEDGIERNVRRQALHDLKRHPFDHGYLRVGFCRDPYTKIISIYRNKLVKAKKVRTQLLELGFYKKMPFNRYVNLVASISDERAEKHLLSQYLFLFRDGPPDVLLRFEDLAAGWGMIQGMFAERGGKKILPLMRLNTSDGTREPILTPMMRELIFERYKKDFELLGYKR